MSKPVAVLLSDVHYSVHTLDLSDKAMRIAIQRANDLEVPLIVAGDLHDTKANLRGECVNAMIETFNLCNNDCYILRGNHDSINEKSKENSINFLGKENIWIINKPEFTNSISINGMSLQLIPYEHDVNALRKHLKTIDKGFTLVMHQGIIGSNSGEYIQDKSAIFKEDVSDFRVISGHYHARQDIKTGRPQKGAVGLFSYIGNPYTLSFGEANDPPKGFQILMNDGTLEFVPTNLRKHVILNIEKANNNYWQITGKVPIEDVSKEDLVYAKVKGTKEELSKVTKEFVQKLIGVQSFRLDLIPLNTEFGQISATKSLTQAEILDSIIDSMTNTSDEAKTRLKQTWKDLCE